MRRIELGQILEQIINFDGADQLEVPFVDVLVFWVGRTDLNHAVQIAFVDEADYFFRDPVEPGAD